MNKRPFAFAKNPLALSVASALLALSATSIQAASFTIGDDVEVVFDSSFSYGASYRTEDRNWDTISKVNHPRFNWTGYNAATNNIYPPSEIWKNPGGYSSNGDAGNLNYDKGDKFSELFKGTHELSITKGDFGLFSRFMYFYDSALMDDKGAYTNPVSGKSAKVAGTSETVTDGMGNTATLTYNADGTVSVVANSGAGEERYTLERRGDQLVKLQDGEQQVMGSFVL